MKKLLFMILVTVICCFSSSYHKAVLAYNDGKPEAKQLLLNLEKEGTKYTYTYFMLAKLSRQAGDFAEAETYFKKFISVHKSARSILAADICYSYMLAKKKPQTFESVKKALTLLQQYNTKGAYDLGFGDEWLACISYVYNLMGFIKIKSTNNPVAYKQSIELFRVAMNGNKIQSVKNVTVANNLLVCYIFMISYSNTKEGAKFSSEQELKNYRTLAERLILQTKPNSQKFILNAGYFQNMKT